MMLEIERSFGWPFFTAARGGDALLWQHLFWFFGHPEVYIIFLPAAGLVSMIVPTMARTPLVGYQLIVVALIATGFFSFGLWVHHMFTTGIPALSLALLLGRQHGGRDPFRHPGLFLDRDDRGGRRRLRITTASLFVLGFLFIFTLGGLTGVMVAHGAVRLPGARHLLRRRAFPLRAGRRNGLSAVRRPSTTGRRW